MISTGNKTFLHDNQCCVLFGKRTTFVKLKAFHVVSDSRLSFFFSSLPKRCSLNDSQP